MAKDKDILKRGFDLDLVGNARAFDPVEAEKTRTVPFVISTETKDRHGTIVLSDGWDFTSFNRNPIVDFNHNAMPSFYSEDEHLEIIGKSSAPVVVGKEVHADATFATKEINEKADQIFNMILGGFIRAASVVFRPTKRGEWGKGEEALGKANETYYYPAVELYSWGPVSIPSNTGAGTRKFDFSRKSDFDRFAFGMLREVCPLEISDEDMRKLSLGEILDFTEEGINNRGGYVGAGLEEQIAIQRQKIQLGLK